ncbi:hypothetical protein DFP73DRAFT_597606 [Morchella snyderi]|nr:hypothetical protein DFP73DRAFT_597606 [Morchella snyderi]
MPVKRKASAARITPVAPSEEFSTPPPVTKRQRRTGAEATRRSSRLRARILPPNTNLNINLLPMEILACIFKKYFQGIEDSNSSLGSPLESVCLLGHVCQKWRDLLTSVFDDRRSTNDHRSVSPGFQTTTPATVVKIATEYKIKMLVLSVFAGNSRDVFKLDLNPRTKSHRELEIRNLGLIGLNHHSAEFILTSKFNGLQSITIMHTQIDRICQILSIMKTPIICEKLIIYGSCISTSEMKTIRNKLHTNDISIKAKSAVGELPSRHKISRQICSSGDFEFRKYKLLPPPLEKLTVSDASAFTIMELGLDIHDLRELSVGIVAFNGNERHWHGTQETRFWSGLLRAREKLEKVTISGLACVEDITDLPEALQGMNSECEINFSGGIPGNVIRELKKKIQMMELVRVNYGE